MSELEQKLKGFLTWYQDIYGSTFYADEKMSPLATFREEIGNCSKCPLHKTRTNLVFGEGSEQADIMFIGEAPGHEEDRQGRPFVGRSGKLLNKLLEEFNLRREDVFIANILKSRPPGNRDPKPEEVEACIPYLHRQIEIIAPRVLIALGRVAGQNLLGSKEPLKSLQHKLSSQSSRAASEASWHGRWNNVFGVGIGLGNPPLPFPPCF